jgi:hypothetical protein
MRWRKSKKELEDELGKELVEWGENVERVYEPLAEDDDLPKLDDHPEMLRPKSAIPAERIVHDSNGKVMPCIVCGSQRTVDGRYCRRHRP